ncbi:MAG: MFS transporter [Candidatus Pacebacteria bacterium]|nr:MFS transporter [Candidatus Paceibacterota bacterium]
MLGLSLKMRHVLGTLYTLNFLFGAHVALVVYFHASFLESRGIPATWLGTLFIAGSVLSIIVYYLLPAALNKLGIYKVMALTAIIEFILFISIGYSQHIPSIIIMFILSLGLSRSLSYGLDILLETNTNNESSTGDGRSSFLTMLNMAFVISPFIAGIVLKTLGFGELYLLSALLLIPFVILLKREFGNFKNPVYEKLKILPTVRSLKSDSSLRNIFIIQFLIRFFFAWMVIYMTIYLNQHIGFSLSSIGIMFSVMLIPFVLLEWPLGHFADKKYGEKEFLIAGFIIVALSSYSISYITTADFALWMVVLFITRIGAAIIEVMNEIYFFKHVNNQDTDTISAFRMLGPLAYIIAPTIGSLLLFFMPIQYLFGLMGIIMLIGIVASTALNDTK